MAEHFCYILQCADGSYYTGWTTDPKRRLREHKQGRGSRYTRARRPLKLVYVESLDSRRSAMQRELQIKKYGRSRKQELIANFRSDEEGS